MFVQWCVKGIRGRLSNESSDSGLIAHDAIELIRGGHGIQCNWWRGVIEITPSQIRQKLTAANLDLHINNYHSFFTETPFLSLAAGCVERDILYRTNHVHPAEDTALAFATDNGTRSGFLFYCWVIVGLKPAVSVEAVSEEVRELNSYRRWSAYQLEGEITAKIHVPANQIQSVEWWEPTVAGPLERRTDSTDWTPAYLNRRFSPPSDVSNIRELF